MRNFLRERVCLQGDCKRIKDFESKQIDDVVDATKREPGRSKRLGL